MSTIMYVIQKEFTQLLRNRIMLRIIIIMPVMQLFILAYAVTFEIKTIKLVVVDHDHTVTSRDMISHFHGSDFYKIQGYEPVYKLAEQYIIRGKADQVMVIPEGFEKDLSAGKRVNVQLINDAVDGSTASLMNAYSISIIRDYNLLVQAKQSGLQATSPIKIEYSFWYNPKLDYINFMVPGILVLLVTLIGMFLTGMALVREKELGTLEQINVTPIKKAYFIIGKLVPYWIVALADLAFGLMLAKLAFDIPIVGSLWLIFLMAAVYLLVMQGLGLFISTLTNTQQQSMFLSWFLLVVFILMSGLFTPIESMPQWAQVLTRINPIAYLIESMRMIMLKGSAFEHVMENFFILLGASILVLALAVWRYRKIA